MRGPTARNLGFHAWVLRVARVVDVATANNRKLPNVHERGMFFVQSLS